MVSENYLEMNKSIDDVRDFLAEDVKGYKETDGFAGYYYKNEEGKIITSYQFTSDWKPDQTPSQALDVLEEYCDYDFWTIGNVECNRYRCTIDRNYGDRTINHYANTKTKAIIGVILKAEGKDKLLEVLENE